MCNCAVYFSNFAPNRLFLILPIITIKTGRAGGHQSSWSESNGNKKLAPCPQIPPLLWLLNIDTLYAHTRTRESCKGKKNRKIKGAQLKKPKIDTRIERKAKFNHSTALLMESGRGVNNSKWLGSDLGEIPDMKGGGRTSLVACWLKCTEELKTARSSTSLPPTQPPVCFFFYFLSPPLPALHGGNLGDWSELPLWRDRRRWLKFFCLKDV